MRRRVASCAMTLVLLISCGSPFAPGPTPAPSLAAPRGGTLRLAIAHDDPPPSALASSDPAISANALDPHALGWYDALEIHRCCLTRTLVAYAGRTTSEGGDVLRPDLATALPELSPDGLTWTFRLQRGIHYAPPLDEVEVTAPDVVRAVMRALPVGQPDALGYAGLGQLGIQGMSEYLAGTATTVSGFEIPDPYTLRIHVDRPQGDLPARFAGPDTTPIPPDPAQPGASLGIATGHDTDYGRFLVGTGPYMIEGSDRLDFGLPPDQQAPVSGYVPSASLTLVRNPAWKAATDALRPAYADRIQIAIGGTPDDLAVAVDDGRLDFVFGSGAPPQAPADQIARYRADPALGQVHVDSRDIIRYIEMNLALPPFDDIHVRRALNLIIDKAQLLEAGGGTEVGDIAGHLVLDSLEANLLLEYDAYPTPDGRGDLAAAQAEMRLSAYDRDADGRCDEPACANVPMLTFRLAPGQVEVIAAGLDKLGISTHVVGAFPPDDVFARWHDPDARIGLVAGGPWAKDTLDAAHFFVPVFDSRWSMTDHVTNGHMVGVSRDQLARWGYPDAMLPSIDDRIDACHALVDGLSRVRCWSNLDQYLTEQVVPWVPLFVEGYTRTVAKRVLHYSFDQYAAMPALDQIALPPEA